MNINWINISRCEILFWGGIVIMAGSILAAIISMVVFRITGRRLKGQLEKEYGKLNH